MIDIREHLTLISLTKERVFLGQGTCFQSKFLAPLHVLDYEFLESARDNLSVQKNGCSVGSLRPLQVIESVPEADCLICCLAADEAIRSGLSFRDEIEQGAK